MSPVRTERGVRRRRLRTLLVLVAIGAIALASGSDQSAARLTVRRELTVDCGEIIGSTRSTVVAPSRVLFGAFAGPRAHLQRAARSTDARWSYFAKSGVEIGAGVGPVVVSISPSSRGQAAISWGNGLPVVAALQFARCPPSPDRWNAYAGGFFTRSPTACVQVVVRLGTRSTTMRISIGRRCARDSTMKSIARRDQ